MQGKLLIFLGIFQIVFIILFAIFVRYGEDAQAPAPDTARKSDQSLGTYYPMFQDIHVMMFIGFGFLMTFLKRYGFSSVGLNMLVAAFVLEWATLVHGFLHLEDDGKIHIDIKKIITADFAAATVLISMGALLGKVSHMQLLVMAFIETILAQVNEWIGLKHFKVVDAGESMFVHTFGAYFGLAVARILFRDDVHRASAKEGSVYQSDLFAMIGTVFLWLYWPSFNGGLADHEKQHRAVLNTYYSLIACTVVTFALSSFLDKEKRGKLNMVHIQNATLAGGVAVGTTCDLNITPAGALVIGLVAGIISVVGYRFITPMMSSKLKIHDTCGVHNLHGMPGVLAAIAGIVAAFLATETNYGLSLYEFFPARVPVANTTEFNTLNTSFVGHNFGESLDPGYGRSALSQAGYQALALNVTILIAIVGGVITGFILKLPIWDQPKESQLFDDFSYWEIPEDGFPAVEGHHGVNSQEGGESHEPLKGKGDLALQEHA